MCCTSPSCLLKPAIYIPVPAALRILHSLAHSFIHKPPGPTWCRHPLMNFKFDHLSEQVVPDWFNVHIQRPMYPLGSANPEVSKTFSWPSRSLEPSEVQTDRPTNTL